MSLAIVSEVGFLYFIELIVLDALHVWMASSRSLSKGSGLSSRSRVKRECLSEQILF